MSLNRQFAKFDAEFPEVYELFRKVALNSCLKTDGRLCAKRLLSAARKHWCRCNGRRRNFYGFPVSVNFAARYVRRLVAEHPEMKDRFIQRRLKVAG